MDKQQILEYIRSKTLYSVTVIGNTLRLVNWEENTVCFEIEVKEYYGVADTTFTLYGDEVIKIQTYIKTQAELARVFEILTK